MIKVFIKKQSSYPVGVVGIKRRLTDFFKKNGIVSDAEVSVAVVGKARMMSLGNKYLKDKKLHNVLSFTPTETKNFIFPPDGIVHLGDIVVCYPVAIEEAKSEGTLIDEKIYTLVEHGALHLLGIHHK